MDSLPRDDLGRLIVCAPGLRRVRRALHGIYSERVYDIVQAGLRHGSHTRIFLPASSFVPRLRSPCHFRISMGYMEIYGIEWTGNRLTICKEVPVNGLCIEYTAFITHTHMYISRVIWWTTRWNMRRDSGWVM
jgi:hypothetical protein